MKKIGLLIFSLLFSFILVGCYYHDEEVKLKEIKFYDLDDNEIIGEYKNYFHKDFLKLNSAAPVVNFYCANVDVGDTVKVVMKFKIKDEYQMEALSLKIQDDWSNIDSKMDKIETIDGYTYVTYIVENIDETKNIYELYSWTNESGKEIRFYTKGGNSYIRGFYFPINK